jgi:hypothetical protein
MPKWGPSKAVDSDAKIEEAKAIRRKQDEPDGTVSAAVKYLKMSFLPLEERSKAESDYENEQKQKKRRQEQNDY